MTKVENMWSIFPPEFNFDNICTQNPLSNWVYIEICSTFELGRRWKTEIGSGCFTFSINFPSTMIYRLAYIPSLMFEEGQSLCPALPAWPTEITWFSSLYVDVLCAEDLSVSIFKWKICITFLKFSFGIREECNLSNCSGRFWRDCQIALLLSLSFGWRYFILLLWRVT